MRLLTVCTVEEGRFVSYAELVRLHGDAEVMVVRTCAGGGDQSEPAYGDTSEFASLSKVGESNGIALFTRRVIPDAARVTTLQDGSVCLTLDAPFSVSITADPSASTLRLRSLLAQSTATPLRVPSIWTPPPPTPPTPMGMPLPTPPRPPQLAAFIHPPHLEVCCGIPPVATPKGSKFRVLIDPGNTGSGGRPYRGVPLAATPGRAATHNGALPGWAFGSAGVRVPLSSSGGEAWPDAAPGVQDGDICEKVSYRERLLSGSLAPPGAPPNPFEKMVTASEFGRAAGVGCNGNPQAWVESRTGLGLSDPHRFSGNAATRHGTALEPVARDAYQGLLDVKVRSGGFWVPSQAEYYFLGASPDGVVFGGAAKAGPDDVPLRLIEIKCPFYGPPNPQRHPPCYKGIDPGYYCQVQGQLCISGIETCDFVVYCEGAIMVWRVRQNAAFWNSLLPRLVAAHRWAAGVVWWGGMGGAVGADVLCDAPTLPSSVAASIVPLIPPACVKTGAILEAHPLLPLFHSTHSAVTAAVAASLCIVAHRLTADAQPPSLRDYAIQATRSLVAWAVSWFRPKRGRSDEEAAGSAAAPGDSFSQPPNKRSRR